MDNVALFVTCLIDVFRPSAGMAAVRVLERRGCNVEFPREQTCCGQFSYNAGYQHEAALLARHFVEAFESRETPIVALSGSCAAMVSHTYPGLLYDDALAGGNTVDDALRWQERAQRVGERVVELSRWLKESAAPRPQDIPEEEVPVAYHIGCHMRRLMGAHSEAQEFMHSCGIALVEPVDADQCCGFGGTYSMTEPVVSTALADAKLKTIGDVVEEFQALALTSADLGCLVHLQGRLSRLNQTLPVLHLAELIDLADQYPVTAQQLAELGRS